MTSRTTNPNYEKAAELAKAMRAGLDGLRSTPVVLGTHSASSGLTDLATYADLQSLPPLARKGRVTSRIVRAARSLLRALMRPWLAVQTEFNQGVMAELDDLRRRIAALENRFSSAAAMPVNLRRHDREEVQSAGSECEHDAGGSSGGMPVALHRHEADQDQAVS